MRLHAKAQDHDGAWWLTQPRGDVVTDAYDPAEEGARMSVDSEMSYGDYLRLDVLLGSQRPLSSAHDEMLFIIQHQTAELWMRLILHELDAARRLMSEGRTDQVFKMLARVARIFEQLNSSWDVLRTLTPSEYTTFREVLGSSSGFQSHQYRLIEFMLGNRNLAMMKMHEQRQDMHQKLQQELLRPSLYHLALRTLEQVLDVVFDPSVYRMQTPHRSSDAVIDAWTVIYRNPESYWNLYELAEKLVDLEDYFRRWRFNHVTTVERIIGFKRGTGGTSGVRYLRRMLEVELFPELWHLRGAL
jgi:tryptophan 2,3-dioxygenase